MHPVAGPEGVQTDGALTEAASSSASSLGIGISVSFLAWGIGLDDG